MYLSTRTVGAVCKVLEIVAQIKCIPKEAQNVNTVQGHWDWIPDQYIPNLGVSGLGRVLGQEMLRLSPLIFFFTFCFILMAIILFQSFLRLAGLFSSYLWRKVISVYFRNCPRDIIQDLLSRQLKVLVLLAEERLCDIIHQGTSF